MFSLPRPSPVTKCAASSSSSYVPAGRGASIGFASWSVSGTRPSRGTALWAMSSRNAWLILRAAVVGIGAVDHPAGCHRPAEGVEGVLTQEDLVRWVRRVSLVLIHERRRLVVRFVDVVCGSEHAIISRPVRRAGQDHEVRGAARDEERIF